MGLARRMRVWARQLVTPTAFPLNVRRALHLSFLVAPGALALADSWRNRRWSGDGQRFLVVRYARKHPLFYEIILNWVAANFPEERRRFELRLFPVEISDWPPYVLHIPWLDDPVSWWSPKVFEQANQLHRECELRNIPVVNPVSALETTSRIRQTERMRSLGIRMAETVRVADVSRFAADLAGLRLPLFIREECGHNLDFYPVFRHTDLQRVPWWRLKHPVATEIVDARHPRDGLYRKFRYLCAGDWGCVLHVQYSRNWVTRGADMILNETTVAEEKQWMAAPDPNHACLQEARRALGLDFAAFDYGYEPDGRLVVWEVNPNPQLHFGTSKMLHRRPVMHRVMAAILRMYLQKAGLPVPARLEDLLEGGSRDSEQVLAGLRPVH